MYAKAKACVAAAVSLAALAALGSGVAAQSKAVWPDRSMVTLEAGTNAEGFMKALEATITSQVDEADQQAFIDALWGNLFPGTDGLSPEEAAKAARVIGFYRQHGDDATARVIDGKVSIEVTPKAEEEAPAEAEAEQPAAEGGR